MHVRSTSLLLRLLGGFVPLCILILMGGASVQNLFWTLLTNSNRAPVIVDAERGKSGTVCCLSR